MFFMSRFFNGLGEKQIHVPANRSKKTINSVDSLGLKKSDELVFLPV